jgi:hypothetical protein
MKTKSARKLEVHTMVGTPALYMEVPGSVPGCKNRVPIPDYNAPMSASRRKCREINLSTSLIPLPSILFLLTLHLLTSCSKAPNTLIFGILIFNDIG